MSTRKLGVSVLLSNSNLDFKAICKAMRSQDKTGRMNPKRLFTLVALHMQEDHLPNWQKHLKHLLLLMRLKYRKLYAIESEARENQQTPEKRLTYDEKNQLLCLMLLKSGLDHLLLKTSE